ncbi:MAG: hypothetical protein K2X69_12880 [Silvanigrellaceae bacterium]|nr:hypothetical protein [Silvanigrellaceae bacterium]
MLNLNVIDVNSQEINENDPDFKKALEICSILFHDDIYGNKGNFNNHKYMSIRGTIKIVLQNYGVEAFEFFQKELLDNHLEQISNGSFNPYFVLNLCKKNKDKIDQFKLDKQSKLNKENLEKNTDKQLNPSNSFIPEVHSESRVIPNAFLRSSLFGIIKKGGREMVKEKLIFSLSQYEIYFTGEELDQLDLIVWDALVYLFKQKNQMKSNDVVSISLYEICKFLGYTNNSKIRKQIKDRITRLTYAHVKINFNRKCYVGSLIYGFFLDHEKELYSLEMNKKLINIFSNQDDYTYINANVRNELGQNQLANWLYHFYATHQNPIPFRLGYLKELSRSSTSQKEFNRLIKSALEVIQKAYEIDRIKFEYEIKNGDLYVTKLKNVVQLKSC